MKAGSSARRHSRLGPSLLRRTISQRRFIQTPSAFTLGVLAPGRASNSPPETPVPTYPATPTGAPPDTPTSSPTATPIIEPTSTLPPAPTSTPVPTTPPPQPLSRVAIAKATSTPA